VARLCSWETTRRQTYGGGAFSYFTLTGLAPKRVFKERHINKIGKVKKVITFPNRNQALWNTNKLTAPENFEVSWGEVCANMTCFNI